MTVVLYNFPNRYRVFIVDDVPSEYMVLITQVKGSGIPEVDLPKATAIDGDSLQWEVLPVD